MKTIPPTLCTALAGLLCAFTLARHLTQHHPQDLLWACNVVPWILFSGCILRSVLLVSVAACWSVVGMATWLLDVFTGGALRPGSVVTHVGELTLALVMAARWGMARRAWWVSTVLLAGLMLLTRLVTDPSENVNVVFAVHAGWEVWFPHHALYLALLLTCATVIFLLTQLVLTRILRTNPPP